MMNKQLENNYPQPDPAWDYYEIWNYLIQAKAEIDKALGIIKEEEIRDEDCDLQANEHVKYAILVLQSINFNGLAGF